MPKRDRTFLLGTGIVCDADVLVDTRLLIQANSGGGKSRAIRRILEQTHGMMQHLVIDPEGEFASLREKFDYVLAARHGGDTAADPRVAKLLAQRLLELHASAILDIYELQAHERRAFVKAFLEALVDAPRKLWHPTLVVLDEAHVYAPQQGHAETLGAVIDLCTRGRKRGFSPVLATQRLSKLHKDAAAECNNKLIGRTGLDVDRKRAGEELGFNSAKDELSLRDLRPGNFYVFGPAFPDGVNQVKVGSVETTHPKAGARLAFKPPPPTKKIKALLPQLADLPAEAEEKRKTEQDLRQEVANLKRELTNVAKTAPAPSEELIQQRVAAAVKRLEMEHGAAWLKAENLVGQAANKLEAVVTGLRDIVRRPEITVEELAHISKPTVEELAKPIQIVKTPFGKGISVDGPPTVPLKTLHVEGYYPDGLAEIIGEKPMLVLRELVARHPLTVNLKSLAAFSGYKSSSPTFRSYVNILLAHSLIERIYAQAAYQSTESGRHLAGDVVPTITTHEEMMEMWRKKLTVGQYKVLLVVTTVAERAPVTESYIREVAGYAPTAPTFKAHLNFLLANHLIEEDEGGYRAAEFLFP